MTRKELCERLGLALKTPPDVLGDAALEAGLTYNGWHEERPKGWLYNGDVNLEYGGSFIKLEDWEYGYAEAVRVEDLDSGCGFTGACLIEHLVIIGLDEPERIRSALGIYGHPSMRGMGKWAARHMIAEAMMSYGHYDPAQPDHYWDDSPKQEVVQLEPDGPMVFDGWKADKRLRGTTLEAYVKSQHLKE